VVPYKRSKGPKWRLRVLEKSDDSIQWYCNLCKEASQKLFKMITCMHKRQDEIDSKIEDLSTNINTCNEKLEAQAERISELPTVITEKFVEMFEDKVVE
jgi:uncharacterized coiled-coil DUF342 family protein